MKVQQLLPGARPPTRQSALLPPCLQPSVTQIPRSPILDSSSMTDKVSHSIPPGHEYRFELDQTEAIAIQVRPPLSSSSLELQLTGSLLQLTRPCPSLPFRQLMQGQAEIFGAEMAPKRWYHFVAECKAAVFSWEGATIEMSTLPPSSQESSTYRMPCSTPEQRFLRVILSSPLLRGLRGFRCREREKRRRRLISRSRLR